MKKYINDKNVIQFFTDLGYTYVEEDFVSLGCGVFAYFHKDKGAKAKTITYKEATLIYNKALTLNSISVEMV